MLPIELPLTPMLARPVPKIPPGMTYEPKWDGWRALLARDGDDVRLWSRRGTDLTTSFPELVAAALAMLPDRCVLDGEIVIIAEGRLTYTKLSERHTTPERAPRLAREQPATFLAFDVLAVGADSLLDQPLHQRRRVLEHVLVDATWPLLITPTTDDLDVARGWFDTFETAGLDGVVAKPSSGRYLPGQRTLLKIKHKRTADVVVPGFRLDRTSVPGRESLGSLQLGLYDADVLHWVGVCPGFPGATRHELATMLLSLEVARDDPAYAEHPWSPAAAAASGARLAEGANRWGRRIEDPVHLIEPLLVVEVTYDHLYDLRFRSNAAFLRWRPDRDPESCRFDQLSEYADHALQSDVSGLTDLLTASTQSAPPADR